MIPNFNGSTKSASQQATNNRLNAKRGTMVGNDSAKLAFKNRSSKKAPAGTPPVGAPQAQPFVSQPPVTQGPPMPTGGPALPQEPEFDPAVFAEEGLNRLIGEVRTQQFAESPRVKDAMESIRLRNIMNADNPKYIKDSRPLLDQLSTRMGMDNG